AASQLGQEHVNPPCLPAPRRMKGDPECPEARASPERLSPASRDRPAPHPGPKGGAEGAPDVPDERGGSGRGGLPPLAFSCEHQPASASRALPEEKRDGHLASSTRAWKTPSPPIRPSTT